MPIGLGYCLRSAHDPAMLAQQKKLGREMSIKRSLDIHFAGVALPSKAVAWERSDSKHN